MQEDARRTGNRPIRLIAFGAIAVFRKLTQNLHLTSLSAPLRSRRTLALFTVFDFRPMPIMKGWAMKAFEFINSGPPALLNNPCCCRRVVCFSFLKHAMEVHYG